MHVIGAKAVAFGEALTPEFVEYQKQVIKNAHVLAEELTKHGLRIVSGGTDNHLMLVAYTQLGILKYLLLIFGLVLFGDGIYKLLEWLFFYAKSQVK